MTKTAISASLAVLMLALTAGTSFASNVTTDAHLGGAMRLGQGIVTADPAAASFVNAKKTVVYGDDDEEGDDDDDAPTSAFDPEDGTFDEDVMGFEDSTPQSMAEPLDDDDDDDEEGDDGDDE